MRRARVAVLALVLVTMLMEPAAAGKYRREDSDRYIGPSVGTLQTGNVGVLWCHVGYDWGCAAVDAYRIERFVTVKIEDASGLPVGGALYQYAGNQSVGGYHNFCGSIDKPFKLARGADWVGVLLLDGVCPEGTAASAVTTGEVIFTFTKSR